MNLGIFHIFGSKKQNRSKTFHVLRKSQNMFPYAEEHFKRIENMLADSTQKQFRYPFVNLRNKKQVRVVKSIY